MRQSPPCFLLSSKGKHLSVMALPPRGPNGMRPIPPGLGTFGLCDGLITRRGKAMRCGSVVVHIKIPPSERPYSDHHAYCLFFTKGLCGKCIGRCPVKAITKSGHDKVTCRDYIRPLVADYARSHYGIEAQHYGCGLCQTGVPCESKIPTEDDVQ